MEKLVPKEGRIETNILYLLHTTIECILEFKNILLDKKEYHDNPADAVIIEIPDPDKIYKERYPEYREWAIASAFLCIIWGIYAIRASLKTQAANRTKNFAQAEKYSRKTRMYIVSAIASLIVLVLIVGFPLALSLLVQVGNASKYLNARHYFG
jgi:hypothetical protein